MIRPHSTLTEFALPFLVTLVLLGTLPPLGLVALFFLVRHWVKIHREFRGEMRAEAAERKYRDDQKFLTYWSPK